MVNIHSFSNTIVECFSHNFWQETKDSSSVFSWIVVWSCGLVSDVPHMSCSGVCPVTLRYGNYYYSSEHTLLQPTLDILYSRVSPTIQSYSGHSPVNMLSYLLLVSSSLALATSARVARDDRSVSVIWFEYQERAIAFKSIWSILKSNVLIAVMELQSHRTTSLQMSMLLFRRDTLLLPTLERERSLILGLWSCPCWSLWVSFVNNIVCRDSNSECCLQRLFLYLQLCFFSFQTTSTSQQSEDHSRVMDPWRSLTRSEMLLRLFLKIRTSWPSMIEMKHQQWPLTRDKFCMWYSQLTSNGGHQSIVWTLLFIFE